MEGSRHRHRRERTHAVLVGRGGCAGAAVTTAQWGCSLAPHGSRSAPLPPPQLQMEPQNCLLACLTLIMEYREVAKFFRNSFLMLNRSVSLLDTITRMRVWSSVPAPLEKDQRRMLLKGGRAPQAQLG